MKRLLTATVLALFGLAPAIGSACEDYDASSAAATPPALLAASPAPSASKAPAQPVAKSLAASATKHATAKQKVPADQKLITVSTGN